MAYVSSNSDDEDLKKKQAAEALGGESGNSLPGQNSQAPQPYTQVGFASAKGIFDKNQGAAQQYDVTQPFNEDLSKAKDATQQSFGKIQGALGQQVQSQKTNDNDLSDAIKSGQASGGWGKITGALNPNMLDAEKFKLDPNSGRYSANDVTSLNTAPGIQAAIANQAEKKGVQNYTQGMGALDAAIYQKDAGYRNKVTDLSKQYADADAQRKDYEAQTKSSVEKSNKELADNAASIRSSLSGKSSAIKDQADFTKNSDASKRISDAQRAASNGITSQRDAMVEQVGNSISDPEARERFFRENRGFNLNKYNSMGLTDEKYNYTQDQASQFNNIMQLLGQGDRASSGSGVNLKFDKAGLENDLKSAATKSERDINDARSARAAQLAAEEEERRRGQPQSQSKGKVGGPVVLNPERAGQAIYKEAKRYI